MRRHLQLRAHRRSREGAALAVAMLVVVMLSSVGLVALNAAAYDMRSTQAIRTAANTRSVGEIGLGVTRCEMCKAIDGVALALQRIRSNQGRNPAFVLRDQELELMLNPEDSFFEPPAGPHARGSLGFAGAVAPTAEFQARIERPQETSLVGGYSMRESAGSDSSSLCFRRYRVTANARLTPPGGNPLDPLQRNQASYRAYVIAGPVECSM